MFWKRTVLLAVLLALALAMAGCSSEQSKGGMLTPHYVKGEGYKPQPNPR